MTATAEAENEIQTIKPDVWVIKLDHTEHWDEKFRQDNQIGRIFSVYLFDRNKHVHCCELTPSYELHPQESQWEPAENFDEGNLDDDNGNYGKVDDLIREAEDSDIIYMHVRSVDNYLKTMLKRHGELPAKGQGAGGRRVHEDNTRISDPDNDSDEAIEQAREYGSGNGGF